MDRKRAEGRSHGNMSGNKRKETGTVLSQRQLADGIFDMTVKTSLAAGAVAGQFAGLYTRNGSTLLPRPISICEVDRQNETLRFVYRIAGKGTAEFSAYQKGDTIPLLGVLGNGFPLDAAKGRKTVLMGGGIGIPPMLELAKELAADKNPPVIVLGYRNADLFLKEEMEQAGEVYIATEDGSVGTKGNVLTVMQEKALAADVIMACGPMPMLRAIKAYAAEHGCKAYISLEERMACGVGACLGCVCRTTKKDDHSHVNNARICTDGPVFDAEDVAI